MNVVLTITKVKRTENGDAEKKENVFFETALMRSAMLLLTAGLTPTRRIRIVMTLHTLKLLEKYEKEVNNGQKPFELRKNDRDYKVGDLINFVIVDEKGNQQETDDIYQITYILKDVPQYGLDQNYCILGIKKCGRRFKWYKDEKISA